MVRSNDFIFNGKALILYIIWKCKQVFSAHKEPNPLALDIRKLSMNAFFPLVPVAFYHCYSFFSFLSSALHAAEITMRGIQSERNAY